MTSAPILNREGWAERGLCRDLGVGEADALYFPDRGPYAAEAYELCIACPVRNDCAEYGFTTDREVGNGYRFGMFGGLTPSDREKLQRGAA